MTDRELLELAAKAAGIENVPCANGWNEKYPMEWNPLTDDGDALRLAVKLGFRVAIRGRTTQVEPIPSGGCCEESWNGGDPYAATRRAIVRAAAIFGD